MKTLICNKFNKLYYLKEFDKYLIFNTNNHKWLVFDEIGKDIYELTKEYHSIDEVCQKLAELYHTSLEVIYSDVKQFWKQLLKDKFLVDNREAEEKKVIDEVQELERYPYNTLIISVISTCNLECIYCFNKEKRKNDIENCNYAISKKEQYIKKMIKEFKKCGGRGVLFTGGEPLLYENLFDLCAYAKKMGLATKIITNATKIQSYQRLEELLQNLDEITLSLDSIVLEELRILWNKENVKLEEIYSGLVRINEFSKNVRKVRVVISPIVSKINSCNIDKLIIKVNSLLKNCEIRYELTKYMCTNKEADRMLSITEEEYVNTYIETYTRIGIKDDIVIYNAVTHNGKYMPYPIPNVFLCKPSLFINTDGNVYPCQNLISDVNYLGNIENDSFNDIKNNFINKIKNVCLVKDSRCAECEFRYICPYKGGICKNTLYTDCREKLLKAMYLSLM